MAKLVVLLVQAGAEILDVAGPLQVFLTASDEAGRLRGASSTYEVVVAAVEDGPQNYPSAVEPVGNLAGLPIDTLLVIGGEPSARTQNPATVQWLLQHQTGIRRIGSISTGTFVLAAAGLLDGRRATTHWAWRATLQTVFPKLLAQDDVLFVDDNNVWSSAGATAGIDMALAMIERDLGASIAHATARRLVMFSRRSGDQPQESVHLSVQAIPNDNLRKLMEWLLANPSADLDSTELAKRANMSVRTLFRAFREHLNTTPRAFVEQIRFDAARAHLVQSKERIDLIARRAGFATTASMRRAFRRQLNVSPLVYREQNAGHARPLTAI